MLTQKRFGYRGGQRRGFSPLMLIGISIPVLLALIAAGVVFVLPHLNSRAANGAAAVNMDCTLVVPANPLSAQGLATPYQLVATNPANGPCNEANKMQGAFVQGAVIDPVTGQVSVYNPLVVDQGTQPAVTPTAPTLPPGAVVGLWFGFNGNNLTLQGAANTLNQANCVNGVNNSIFGQFAYCNAPSFFAVANQAIQAGKLAVPPLGMAKDGQTCPTVRDFSVVDMDQSDNVTTTYLSNGAGQEAQNTAANAAALNNAGAGMQKQVPGMANAGGQAQAAMTQTNASDNRLLSVGIDGALGCTPWMVPDLANVGNMATALPLDELQAANQQKAPIALVPLGDPMVLNNAQPDLNKVDMYRNGVGQTIAQTSADANTTTYCNNLLTVAPARLQLDKQFTIVAPSADPAVANSLFTFLAQRLNATYGANGLNCIGLLNKPNPVAVTVTNGIATAATITIPGTAGNGGANGTPALSVNGTAAQFANGQAQVMVNKQLATATLNGTAVTIIDGAANNNGNANGNANNGANGAGAAATPTLTVNGTVVQFANGQAQVTINQQPATATLNGTAITITDGAANNGGGNAATTLTVNGTATQFTNGQAQVTVNQQPATATLNGTAVTITDGAANGSGANTNGNGNNGANGAATTLTLTVNGTAVQFTNGQAQVTINQQPATVTLNGTAITITDGAANGNANGNGNNNSNTNGNGNGNGNNNNKMNW